MTRAFFRFLAQVSPSAAFLGAFVASSILVLAGSTFSTALVGFLLGQGFFWVFRRHGRPSAERVFEDASHDPGMLHEIMMALDAELGITDPDVVTEPVQLAPMWPVEARVVAFRREISRDGMRATLVQRTDRRTRR